MDSSSLKKQIETLWEAEARVKCGRSEGNSLGVGRKMGREKGGGR